MIHTLPAPLRCGDVAKKGEKMGWLKKVWQGLVKALPDIKVQSPPGGNVKGGGISNGSVRPVNTGGKKPGSWSSGRHK